LEARPPKDVTVEIARLKSRQAEEEFAIIEGQFRVGLIRYDEFMKAKHACELAAAELARVMPKPAEPIAVPP
jgi:hypothetical protein